MKTIANFFKKLWYYFGFVHKCEASVHDHGDDYPWWCKERVWGFRRTTLENHCDKYHVCTHCKDWDVYSDLLDAYHEVGREYSVGVYTDEEWKEFYDGIEPKITKYAAKMEEAKRWAEKKGRI